MEIEKAKELRNKLQEDILQLVQKFEDDTKTNVDRIYLDSVKFIESSLTQTVKVQVEFKF
jgi:hypothetical protein